MPHADEIVRSSGMSLRTTPRKRILYVATEDWFFRSHFSAMARAAQQAGFDVSLAARPSDAAPAIAAEGIRVIPIVLTRGTLNPIRILAETIEMCRLFRRERPDILHLIALKAIFVGGLAAMCSGQQRVVNSVTGIGFLGVAETRTLAIVRRLVWPIFSRLLGRAKSWILVDNRDDARTLGGKARNTITCIGGAGVDPDYFCELPPPQRDPVTAAVVARMLWSKGIDTIVTAQALLRERGIDIGVTLAGPTERDTPNALPQAMLEAWSRRPGIRWIGPQSDVRAVWRDAHIAVLASRGGEGLPRALLEAAACGRPIVTTDVPGCRDFVRTGIEGFVVPPDDPNALADALAKLSIDAELRRTMGRNARARVFSGFTEKQVSDAVVALYALVQRTLY
jgi:glycosyltransferase involved in cell wall biosynthesis